MKTKIIAILFSLVANIGTVFAWGIDPLRVKIGDLYYNLDFDDQGNRAAEVAAQGSPQNNYEFTSVTIPVSVSYGGYSWFVQRIGHKAFANCTNLQSITFNAAIHIIGSYAFEGCTGLTTITLPESVSEIQGGAFSGCTHLNTINIPDRVINIGPFAFYNCTAFINANVPSGVRYVGTDAFYNVGNVNYEQGYLVERSGAFPPFGARMLNGYIEDLLVYIDNTKKALMACSSDAEGNLTISNNVTAIHNSAFYNCKKLTNISIPNSVTKIWNNAFHGCTGLSILNIPNSVTSIGNGAFEGCTGLTTMLIPNSVTSLGDSVFMDCSSLTTLQLPNMNTLGCKFLYNCKNLSSLTIPNSVTSIGTYAFGKCSSLKSLILPENVTNVGDYAFAGCTNLQYIKLGKKITQLKPNAFNNCINLKGVHWNIPSFEDFNFSQAKLDSIIFGDNVLQIPNNICAGQNLLSKAELHDGITVIGENSFSGCTSLGNIHFPNALQKIKANAFNGTPLISLTIPLNVDEIGTNAFLGCNPKIVNWNADGTGLNPQNMDFGNRLEKVIFSDKVKVIHPNLFKNQTKISELYIPSGYVRVGAFEGCTGLQKLTFGANVTKLDASAFKGCTNLSGALVLSDALDTIPSWTFSNCTKITSVTIGKNAKKISGFEGCTGIKTVYNFSYQSFVPHAGGADHPAYYADRVYNNPDIQGDFIFSGHSLMGYTGNAAEITLPATYKGTSYSIEAQAFADATQLIAINIPDAVSYIGISAFAGCTGLISLSIPNSVTQIWKNAFDGCSNITSVSIGANMQSIGANAFANCSSIQDISCSAQTPPTANANTFSNVPTNATLYVPAGSRSAYQSAQGWNRFTNIVESNLVNVTGVSLNASTLTLAKKGEAVLYATVAPSNATYKTVAWSSSNTSVAEVTNGVVYGKNAGTATITCTTTNGGRTATCDVTVLASEVLATGFKFYKYAARNGEEYVPYSEMNPEDTLSFMELGTGFITVNVQPYSVTNGEVNFSVSDPSILSASLTSHINFANSIQLKPLHSGTTKITFSTTDGSNITSSVYVQITPDPTIKVTGVKILKKAITLAAKEKDTLSVQIFPVDATNTSVEWTSEDATIASVLKEIGGNRGVVTAKNLGKTGPVKIICTTKDGGYSDTCVVNVIAKRISVTGLSLNQTSKTLSIGETLQLTPIFTPSNATNQNIYWYTDNDTIISLHDGLVRALHEGVDTVRCISEDGCFEAKCVITVQEYHENIPVTGVTIDERTLQLVVGETKTLTASVYPLNATNKTVIWTSSNSTVATITNSGAVIPLTPGISTIICETSDGHFKAECYIVVVDDNSETDYSFEPTTISSIRYEASDLSFGEMPEQGCVFVGLSNNDYALYLMYMGSLTNGTIPAGTYPVSSSLQTKTICYSIGGDDANDYGSFLATGLDGEGHYSAAYYVIAGTLIVNENNGYHAKLISANGSDIDVTYSWTEMIENIPTVENASKILHNGQIFILRGDKIYTMTGQLVK